MLKKICLLVVLVATMSFANAFAQMGMMDNTPMMGREMMGMMSSNAPGLVFCINNAEKLGIASEQLAKLKTLHYEHKKTVITLNADKDLKQLELNELINKDEPDLNAVEGKLKEIADIDVKIKISALKTHKKAKEILTPEQIKKLKDMMMDKMTPMRSDKGSKRMMMKGMKGTDTSAEQEEMEGE